MSTFGLFGYIAFIRFWFGDTLTRCCLNTFLLLHLILFISLSLRIVNAGLCWGSPDNSGKCTDLLQTAVTKEECCYGGDSSNNGIATTAYSHEDLKSGKLFFYRSLRGGVPCIPCKSTCEDVKCGFERKCTVNAEQQPVCICAPKCSRRKRRMGSVCGSDGRTYRHVCRLLQRRCRKDVTLSVEYYGQCQQGCDKVRCEGSKACVLDHTLKPHCVRCKKECPPTNAELRAVCGIDNVTYTSYCHLQKASCLKGKAVTVAYSGNCKSKPNKQHNSHSHSHSNLSCNTI